MNDTQGAAKETRPLGNYSKVRVSGPFIYVAGTTARQPDGSIAGTHADGAGKRHDAAHQTRVTLDAIARTLETVGASLDDCIDMTVFLTDMDDFPRFNEAYGEYFGPQGPARTTVGVARLPHPDMVVEIKAVACRKEP